MYVHQNGYIIKLLKIIMKMLIEDFEIRRIINLEDIYIMCYPQFLGANKCRYYKII